MHYIITLLLFIIILGIIVFVHEFGHFIWAKKFGVHIYEFSIGMGPIIKRVKGKDGIDYNIRALPIGGFVSMAGEVYEDDKKVAKKKCLCNKPVWQRVIVMAAGVINNFILAIIVLFIASLIWGSHTMEPVIKVLDNYPMQAAGLKDGDKILSINNHKVNTWDEALTYLAFKNDKGYYDFKIEHEDKTIKDYRIVPVKEDVNGEERTMFGMQIHQEETNGIFNKIKYTFQKFASIISSMIITLGGLFTGRISLNALSGPVGIYSAVGQSLSFDYLLSLLALLSINVGVINILPFPAFDGGRIFFLIIEKIKGSPVNQKFENWCHIIGFILLMILIVYITIQDIIRLF